jgi:hypothetical protein
VDYVPPKPQAGLFDDVEPAGEDDEGDEEALCDTISGRYFGQRAMSELGEITRLLHLAQTGDKLAESKLLDLSYSDLRRLAAAYLARERRDHTLQPTALLHEAYLRLTSQGPKDWKSRSHFVAAAAQAMHYVLVDWAGARSAKKRGGRMQRVNLDKEDDVALRLLRLQPLGRHPRCAFHRGRD